MIYAGGRINSLRAKLAAVGVVSLVASSVAVAATLAGPANAGKAARKASTAAVTTDASTIFGSARPETTAVNDTGSVVLGMKFRSSQAGYITGIRFYKGTGNTGTHQGALWSATGTRLASVTFTNETSYGWQSANFATPVKISADTTYIAGYLAPNGRYASDSQYFATSKTSGPLTATGSRYVYGSTLAFPTWTHNLSNYYVDVTYSAVATSPAPTPSPTPAPTVTPAPSATPAPTVTPAPTPSQPAPSGSILWKADAEQNLWDEWASISTQSNCSVPTWSGMTDSRVSRVSSPRVQGSYAWRAHIEPGDVCYDERVEFGQGGPDKTGFSNRQFKSGDEVWISFQANPSAGVVNAQYWQSNFQFKQLNAGGGAFGLEILNGRWQLSVSDTNQVAAGNAYNRFWSAPATAGLWAKLTLHVKFSSDPNVGFLELYGDPNGTGVRLLMAKRNTWTMKVNTNVTYLRTGIYRDARNNTAADLFIDGLTVATTRATAESNAIG